MIVRDRSFEESFEVGFDIVLGTIVEVSLVEIGEGRV
jgi:hypothetical protein